MTPQEIVCIFFIGLIVPACFVPVILIFSKNEPINSSNNE